MKFTDDFDSVELSEPIFKDVKYYVTGKLPQRVSSLLNDGGAKKTNYISEIVTHCIAGEDFDESEISEAQDIYEIQSVTWKWVVLSAKCGSLLPVKGFLAEKTQLFSGVVACVSLLSQEDNHALWAMLNFYGGELTSVLNKSVTHLIVAKPSGVKYERALKERERGKTIEIVTPDWVVESVKNKSRCDESLYHPNLLILAEERSLSSLADITGFAEPESTEEAQQAAKPASGVLDPTRYEKLMEMLDQRKQQEEKVNMTQQQLSNIQLQQQQLLQQQKQQMQQQQQLGQEMPPQQPSQMVQRPPQMAQQQQQQPQMMQQQQQMVPQVQQMQQMQQQPQQGMIPQQQQQQQQQQRFQFVQQQQQQQRMQQGAIIQGQQGQRIMLTQQQLQQRAMQGSMQFRAPRYIFADGKQYVINSAQQAQQVANLVQNVQDQQQQQQLQPQMQQSQQNIQGVQQQQPQQQFVNAGQANVATGQAWQQGQPQQQQQQQQFQMQQQQPQQQQQMPQQFQMQQHQQQMQVNQQQQQMQMQQQQPQQVAGAMQMNQVPVQNVQQVVTQHQGAAGQMQGQVQHQLQGQVTQIQQVGQMQGQMQQPQQTTQRLLWQQTTPQGQRQYFQLDPQTHQQLQAMDAAQRQVFIQKLQKRQQLIQLQQQQAQARLQQQQQAGGVAVQGAPRPPLNPQQQAALRQQFQQQQQRMGLNPQWREGVPNQQGPRTVLIQGQQQIVVQAGITRPQQPMAVSSPQVMPAQGHQQQQQWATSTPGAPQQAVAPVQTVPAAGIQTPGGQIVAAGNLTPEELQQRQQALMRQQQMRRMQLMKQQQLQQAAQVVPGQVVQASQVVQAGQVVPSQVVQGPRMGTPPFAVAQGAVPGQVPQQVAAAQQAATPVEDASASNSGPTTPQPATGEGQVGTLTPPQQQQQAQFQQPGVAGGQQVAMVAQQAGGAGVVSAQSQQQQQQQFLLTYQQRGRAGAGAGPNQPTQVLVRNAQGIVQYTSTRVLAMSQQTATNIPVDGAQPPGQQPTAIQIQYQGQSPNVKVPPDLCLLGCVFYFSEYANMYSAEELDSWRAQIINFAGEVENVYSARVTHFVCPHQRVALAPQALRDGKRLVTAFWLNDVLIKQRMCAPWQFLHLPMFYNEDAKPLKKFIITSSGFPAEEKERIKYIVCWLGGRYTPYLTKENKILICRKAEGKKYTQARQWRTTVVNTLWLHEVMLGQWRALHGCGNAPKYLQFNDNPLGLDHATPPPHLMVAWKVSVAITQEIMERGKLIKQQHDAAGQKNAPKKRPAPVPIDQANRMDRPAPKMPKLTEPTQNGETQPAEVEAAAEPKVFFQLSHVAKRDELKRKAEELGAVFTKDLDKITHLVMKEVERTEKLLCAISRVNYVVSEKWIMESSAQQKLLDAESFVFCNSSLEQHYGFSLKELLKKPNRSQLFKGRVFYISPGCTPSVRVIEDVIVCAGGQVERKRRPAQHVLEANKASPNSYIVIAETNDLHLLVDYINADIDIFSAEMVYSSIFKQSLDSTDKHKIVLR